MAPPAESPGVGAALGSPLADPLGAGVAVSVLRGAEGAAEGDAGDGVGEAAVPSPEPEEPAGPGESGPSEEPESPEVPAGPEDVVLRVTAPLTVVPWPPLKLVPATSSQAVMPAMVTPNTRAAATSGRRQVRTRAR
ncbi:hypothetical protein ABT189_19275 [Streptomyces sp900105755]|uniref:hypothetical protein n=1 Tax=Streptomyces sp. 900105755 TaxID=3154389 RepID=UPI00332C86C1